MENTENFNWTYKIKEYFDKKGKIPKAFVQTYGCQGNVADSERIKGMIFDMGYLFCDDVKDADLIIFNTCAVREHAEDRVFGNLGRLKKLKIKNPDLIIAVCGCMVQRESVAKRLKNNFNYVDLIFGTFVTDDLPKLLYQAIETKKTVIDISENNLIPDENVKRIGKFDFKAFVPITYGCDNFCTYCIVPYVRGRLRSVEYQDVLSRVSNLVKNGYKEITLLGQNVNAYGKDLQKENLFSKLLEDINNIDGDFIVRFMTSHPKDLSFHDIETISKLEKVEKHLHLPVQSGSDRILKLMNRKYDSKSYLKLVDYAKSLMPQVTFSSDIIVGFPGETREDFDETLNLIKQVGYSNLYTFIYSKREKTKAAEFHDETDRETKVSRLEEILQLQKQITKKLNENLIGTNQRILIDEKRGENSFAGKTLSNVLVTVNSKEDIFSKFINVKITDANISYVSGEIIKE
ncbi:MAG: tRNA (N6-isopentenyl adenosine(37)-C2)-methylthiotransferase MiaB [Clostridia bacterium]|nr:tRNA (N6-isopentenyl adenosine(37)-C2)-methylthiotransferase MiaB [Clostridia bacterium]